MQPDLCRSLAVRRSGLTFRDMATHSKARELEVFVNDMGTISIRREGPSADEGSLVVIHPDEVSTLIGALDHARRKASGVGVNDTDEITIPAIEYARRPVNST
jgi:hypothetical protein